MKRITTSLLIFAVTSALTLPETASARIYKTVDKDGNVVFTDVPPKDQSKAVELAPGNVYQGNEARPDRPAPAPTPTRSLLDEDEGFPDIDAEPVEEDSLLGGEEPEAEGVISYESLRIASPSDDEAVRANAGNITIRVQSSPGISQNDQLQILLDGNVVAVSSGDSASLTNVDRGTHTVVARIIDADGKVKISSEPTEFHLLRHSIR